MRPSITGSFLHTEMAFPITADIATTKPVTSAARFSGQTIMITGATGFIGSHLCRSLRHSGAEIHAISRTNYQNPDGVFRWWQGDLSEAAVARELVAAIKPDIIFHLASYNVGARHLGLVMPTLRSNLISTVNLLSVASEIGCRRIILAGSLEEPDSRNGQGTPCSPYAVAKWAASAYARMFHALFQLPVVTLRIFMTYGPAQRDKAKLIPYVTLSLLRGQAPKLTSGQRPVDWVYVDDVVEGIIAAAQADDIDGSTIDIGSGELIPVRTVVKHLVRRINPNIEPLFGAVMERPLEQIRVADTARTSAIIGWRSRIPLEEGLRRTVNWYERSLE